MCYNDTLCHSEVKPPCLKRNKILVHLVCKHQKFSICKHFLTEEFKLCVVFPYVTLQLEESVMWIVGMKTEGISWHFILSQRMTYVHLHPAVDSR